ncbi:MAG: sigma-54 dependent transcriptional regulator [Sedimentibacter sp.]|uniref:sigma-54-dependent transcriptional regulator n=1 Tax=Sedimentibacter sp. TaxID=1960295 RepID=UPI0029824E74|nr:sigma-54 dependent transcriptional regulator [Sedimentibacter sp.]MDW5298516.1 sigma-54 dependent transcriptional regulator [Sedimentibacter sp.]
MKNKLLIIDDEPKILRSLKFLLDDYFEIYTSDNSTEALNIFKKEGIYLVLLDLRLKEDNGLNLMEKLLEFETNAIIIIMTAHSTIENSINAIKSGAYYFITKPIDNDQLLLLLNTANEKLKMLHKINHLEVHVKKDIIGESSHIKEIMNIIDRIKDTDATILITGESGTGKELIAQKIHRSSNRADKPFVSINCAAMPGELLESELFGYKKGAFTGAFKDEIGIIRRADKGTLLLDEIGEMDLRLQSKLLRFLQGKEVRQIGDDKACNVDVRIICVTNKNLKAEVEAGRFREDLYYRINVINLVAPPLRERINDLKYLVPYFIDKYNISFNKNIKGITDEAYEILSNYSFKGNIRELENIIQRAVLLTASDYIEPDLLQVIPQKIINSSNKPAKKYIKVYEGENMKEIEKKVIEFALENNNQNRKWTAETLGIGERTLRYKIKEYDL